MKASFSWPLHLGILHSPGYWIDFLEMLKTSIREASRGFYNLSKP